MSALAIACWTLAALVVLFLVVHARRTGRDVDRFRRQWAAAGLIAGVGLLGVGTVSVALVGWPQQFGAWAALCAALAVVGFALGSTRSIAHYGGNALIAAFVATGLTALVGAVYLCVVAALGRVPDEGERQLLLWSMAAALLVALLVLPASRWLAEVARRLAGERRMRAYHALESFGTRMTRSVPMDELTLQLCENLRDTLAPAGAEVWTGSDGHLMLNVSVPHRSEASIWLGERERDVTARAGASGNAWLAVWIPALLSGQADQLVRVTPAAHQGELLGLVVVRRPRGSVAFSDDDDAVLGDIGRQLGLALHNVRLDTALQDSLEQLQASNVELQASRSRVVAAADESRRRIERDLHDGAQQHLVSIAVRLGLVATIAGDGNETVSTMLTELRAETQETIQQLRDLAHGIYPPLLRQSGLSEALRAAATRNPLDPVVRVDLPGRYSEDVETAIYFCCLEAMQNASKYAGAQATLTVTVEADDDAIRFDVRDNGPGFTLGGPDAGSGFVNMRDRMGSVGGRLIVSSAPGQGTSVRGVVKARPGVLSDVASTPAVRPAVTPYE